MFRHKSYRTGTLSAEKEPEAEEFRQVPFVIEPSAAMVPVMVMLSGAPARLVAVISPVDPLTSPVRLSMPPDDRPLAYPDIFPL